MNFNTEKLLEDIKSGKHIENKEEFEIFIYLFTQTNFEEDRKRLYVELMNKEGFISLAATKHYVLKQLFAHYVSTKLIEAKTLNLEHYELEAKNIIDSLSSLQLVFKSHDVINFREFISETESDLLDIEVDFLFLKPILNKEELDNIQNAFLKVLGKKHINLYTKTDFQLKFYNHPLINCLNAYKHFEFISNQVFNNVFLFGEYDKLIKTLMKLNLKEMHEEYQGFISFLIKEDLTIGFANILKNEHYTPKYLRELLQKITSGIELDDIAIKKLIIEIKEQHTKNVKLTSTMELKTNISSKHSLNDYGFEFLFDNKNFFFHGHETGNHGINQHNQQANTAISLRNFGYDTIGLTVLTHNVTRDNEARCWINSEGFKGLLKLTILEEVMLSGLQFDAQYIQTLALNSENDLRNSDFLSSNNYIVKSDIKHSQDIINFNIGKSDLELIYEKKNAYLSIFRKNPDFFRVILETTSTDNQAQFQLIAEPFLKFVIAIRDIEDTFNISVFTEEDVNVIQSIIEPLKTKKNYNVSIGTLLKSTSKGFAFNANFENLSNKYTQLQQLISNNSSRLINQKSIDTDLENLKLIQKIIKKGNLEDVVNVMDKYPLSNNCPKQSKTALAKNLEFLIDKESKKLLLNNYNINKVERMFEYIAHIDGITQTLRKGNNIDFNSSDYIKENSNNKILAELLKDPKKENILLLKGFCHLADLKGGQINCSKIPLRDKLKI